MTTHPKPRPQSSPTAPDPVRKAALGQFMTPPQLARFMAGLFPPAPGVKCHLLDAGAGAGALSSAFLERWQRGELEFASASVTAYEIDPDLRALLTQQLHAYAGADVQIHAGDFIELAAQDLLWGTSEPFTHAILNPPYRKIGSHSPHRLMLRQVGIETVNLYSAFVALAIALLAPGGQLVALIPRSFCNGPYYRPFREFLLSRTAIRHLHLFESRTQAFKADDVLQENIIIRLEKGGQPGPVTVSTSTDASFADLVSAEYSLDQIVLPGDSERFIHVPASPELHTPEQLLTAMLAEVGVQVSTGPVVDFRLREHLRDSPEAGAVPLLYPAHLAGGVNWPLAGGRKPNAIVHNSETEKWLYPTGFYCVVKRLTSKEEARRVVATVIDPATFPGAEKLGFENHLNVLHERKQGLPEALAHGLAAYLNSTQVDRDFRRFSGHTQVNATDLRGLKYPSRAQLLELGAWAMERQSSTQDEIDERIAELTT
ncbi:Eco57I restriction-modification methylase domain-containing protein [Deinococcus marmoris]|uniref:Eco57I restriction-modification methylase domain-containing protein n=1 Tax=Deinococcus marmoris TaxID=249408 RepID=UPI0005568523|nr:Eco57I restriction-modification methylase domain-containing protein [Deinococcus marmoris]